MSSPSMYIVFTNFLYLQSEQVSPFKNLSPYSTAMPVLNSIMISIYGMDRCPTTTISLKLESYKMNKTNSLLLQIIQIIIHLMIYKIICLLTMFYKYKILTLLVNTARNKLIDKHGYNANNIDLNQPNENINIDNNNKNIECEFVHDKIEHRELNIVWTNLTIKVSKSLFKNEKIILRDINGFVEFGTLMALMGPSGAGKSTLLKALMGINKKMIAKESKFYCNKNFYLKPCFISQDVRQHITSGLTVGQSLTYASKLKNLTNNKRNVDNSNIIDTLMKDFGIEDIKDVNIDKCSSGQQKRCILAMELCAQKKPSIVCVDEPTSGLDSYSSLMVTKILVFCYFWMIYFDKNIQTVPEESIQLFR